MRFLVVIFISFLILTVASCNPSDKYKAEIAEIDSCLSVLDSVESLYNGINFDSLKLMVAHVLDNEDSIQLYYHPDTLSLDIGTRMNECKGIRKSLKNLDAKQDDFAIEISAIRTQLANLKVDIENGVLAEEKMKGYIEQEKMDLNVLNLSLTDFYNLQELQKRYYYYSVPFIDELIVQWKNEAQPA